MTTVLAFDCAISGLGIAVVRNGECVASCRDEARDQSESLLPAIARLLGEHRIDKHELSMIAVTTGPGSFTGVRVGLAAGRGLAAALAIPLAGIATTRTLLEQAGERGGRLVVAAIDSRLGDWFCALDEGDKAPFLASTTALKERLNGRVSLIVGPQATTLAPQLDNSVAQIAFPDPATIARLALTRGIEGWREENRRDGLPRPLYLRGVNVTLPDGARRTVE